MSSRDQLITPGRRMPITTIISATFASSFIFPVFSSRMIAHERPHGMQCTLMIAHAIRLQVFVLVLALFAFWYCATVVLLLRNFDAMKQTWALNLLGTLRPLLARPISLVLVHVLVILTRTRITAHIPRARSIGGVRSRCAHGAGDHGRVRHIRLPRVDLRRAPRTALCQRHVVRIRSALPLCSTDLFSDIHTHALESHTRLGRQGPS
jgi:hypothetical protein